ncbi:hypothetical protein POPTR_010G189401v4 [Populus trichocarpa]|uniref:Uncharacterized protein n=1 Tax=Populus trichocarpa TaxID=3694 RepID=A0ACC0SEB6_POPTR|nr:hypothetical protein POPTR_010G189401v4 [Populus trichocarpa]
MIKRVRFSRKSLKRHLVATIDKFIVHVARTHDGQKLSVRMGWLMKLVKVCPRQVESTSGWASWWGWWAVQVAVATIAFH